MVSSATLWNRRGLPRLGTAMATAPLALQGLGGGDGDLAQAARAENVTTEPRAAPRRRQESPAMRIVGVEEHFVFSDLLARVASGALERNGWPTPGTAGFAGINPPALSDTGEDRVAAMDAAGISMQVLSVPGPGAELVAGADGVALAREYNDRLARLISAEPERFAGFAHLPMTSPRRRPTNWSGPCATFGSKAR